MSYVTPIRPATFRDLQKSQPDLVLLDVRTPGEYASGHIPTSKLLPVSELPRRQQDLPQDLDQTIVVYCQSGGRSSQAANYLSQLGYSKVYDLGGIMGWPYEVVRNG